MCQYFHGLQWWLNRIWSWENVNEINQILIWENTIDQTEYILYKIQLTDRARWLATQHVRYNHTKKSNCSANCSQTHKIISLLVPEEYNIKTTQNIPKQNPTISLQIWWYVMKLLRKSYAKLNQLYFHGIRQMTQLCDVASPKTWGVQTIFLCWWAVKVPI